MNNLQRGQTVIYQDKEYRVFITPSSKTAPTVALVAPGGEHLVARIVDVKVKGRE